MDDGICVECLASTGPRHRVESCDTITESVGQTVGHGLNYLLKNRNMIRRTDLLKVLFVVVCVCHVCPAHPCGDNPMKVVDNFSRNNGVESATMLIFMRRNTPADYASLMHDYRRYLDCTQMVQNGYFKRSVDAVQINVPPTLTKNEPIVDSWPFTRDAVDDSDRGADTAISEREQEKGVLSKMLMALIQRKLELRKLPFSYHQETTGNDVDGSWGPVIQRHR